MHAHLHAVPDPEPDDETPSEWLPLVKAVSELRRAQLDETQHASPDEQVYDWAQDDDEDLTDQDGEEWDEAGEEQDDAAGEETILRSFAVPDLRPYADPRPLRELGPLAADVTKTTGPPLLRALGRVLAFHWRGLASLLALAVAWLCGQAGQKPGIGYRWFGAGLAVYYLVKLSQRHALVPWLVAGAVLVLTGLVASGRIEVPDGKPAKKDATSDKDGKAEAPAEEPQEARKETATAPRRGFLTRLTRRPSSAPEQAPTGATDEAPTGATDEAPASTPDEAPDKAPVEDPLTALIRAEIGTDNGVHLNDLRPAMRKALPGLSQATDEELRRVLTEAGWDPSKTFRARGFAGRAGVHRNQLPPPLSPETPSEPSPGPLSAPLHPSRPANSSPPGEQRREAGEWTEEQKKRGFRSVPDPERGPAASRIQHYEGGDLK